MERDAAAPDDPDDPRREVADEDAKVNDDEANGQSEGLPNGMPAADSTTDAATTSGSVSPTSSTNGSSYLPLPPLPIDVFLRIMHYLPTQDVAIMRRVSSAWRGVIDGDPRLWSVLSCSLLDFRPGKVLMYKRNAAPRAPGQRGGIRRVNLMLEPMPPGAADRGECVKRVIRHVAMVIKAVSEASVTPVRGKIARDSDLDEDGPSYHSSLRVLSLKLYPCAATSVGVLQELADKHEDPVFCQLHTLDVHVNLQWFPLGAGFLHIFPSLSRLSIRGAQTQFLRLNWIWDLKTDEDFFTSLPNLRELVLENVRLTADVDLPLLPSLVQLSLCNVIWDGRSYYLLFRAARRTLERAEVDGLYVRETNDPFFEYTSYLDVREPEFLDGPPPPPSRPDEEELREVEPRDPIPIQFPVLRYLRLSGTTPAIFAPARGHDNDVFSEEYPTPLFEMPALVECVLEDTPIDALNDLNPGLGQLATLGHVAPNIRFLTLRNLNAEDEALYSCLQGMHGRIVRLDLSESTFSNQIICRLPQLTPMVRELDVRGATEVSVQSVARVVEVVRAFFDDGQSKLARVWVDPPMEGWTELRAYDWLAFVGVLQRDELDPEGDGPLDPEQRRLWIKAGKRDVNYEHRIQYEQWEQQQAMQRLHALQVQATSSGSGSLTAAIRGALPPTSTNPQLPGAAPMGGVRQLLAAAPPMQLTPSKELAQVAAMHVNGAVGLGQQRGRLASAQADHAQIRSTSAHLAATNGAVHPRMQPEAPAKMAVARQAPAAAAATFGGARPPPPTVQKTAPVSAPAPPPPATSEDFDVGNVDSAFVDAQVKEMARFEAAQAARVQAQIEAAEQAAAAAGAGRPTRNANGEQSDTETILEYDEAVPAVREVDDDEVVDVVVSDGDLPLEGPRVPQHHAHRLPVNGGLVAPGQGMGEEADAADEIPVPLAASEVPGISPAVDAFTPLV
ncbi:hypothetical protein JCM8202v2_000060 [Rhodotorula sphaerocarpa]